MRAAYKLLERQTPYAMLDGKGKQRNQRSGRLRPDRTEFDKGRLFNARLALSTHCCCIGRTGRACLCRQFPVVDRRCQRGLRRRDARE